MKGVTESLAGRIGIMNMYSFTYQEIMQIEYNTPTDFSLESLQKIKNPISKLDINFVFENIYYGGMPKIIGNNETARKEYFYSYINSYLQKDAMELGKISDTVKFNKFLVACASQVSNVVNYANLAMASDIPNQQQKIGLKLCKAWV